MENKIYMYPTPRESKEKVWSLKSEAGLEMIWESSSIRWRLAMGEESTTYFEFVCYDLKDKRNKNICVLSRKDMCNTLRIKNFRNCVMLNVCKLCIVKSHNSRIFYLLLRAWDEIIRPTQNQHGDLWKNFKIITHLSTKSKMKISRLGQLSSRSIVSFWVNSSPKIWKLVKPIIFHIYALLLYLLEWNYFIPFKFIISIVYFYFFFYKRWHITKRANNKERQLP